MASPDDTDQLTGSLDQGAAAPPSVTPSSSSSISATSSPILTYNTAFRDAYVQTRHKNLRCFPICSAIHMEKSFCGRIIDVCASSTDSYSIPTGKPLLVSEFRCTMTPLSFTIGEQVESVRLRDPRFIIAELVVSDPGELRFVINPNRKWFYPRTTTDSEIHTYTSYLLMDGTLIAHVDSPTFRVLPIWKEERRPTAPGIPAGPKVLVPQSPFHKRLKRNEAASFIHNQRALSHAASLDDLRRNNPPQGGMNHPGDSGMLVRSLQMSIPSPSKPIAYGESSPSLYPPSSNSWNNVASGYASNSGPASYFNPPHPFNMSQPMLNLMQPFQQQFAAVSSSLPQGSHALYPSYFNNLSGQPPLPGQLMSASPSSPRYQHPVPINAAGQGYLSANLDDNHNQVANRLSRFQQSLISLPHPNFHFNHTINSRGPFVSEQDGKFLLPNPNVLKDSKNMDGM